ncbi:NAD(P)H-dependent oxidoreductase [Bacillus sp. ISL-39]|uniref:NAD(P)H-dependent oxidoreductase n=1 Tax=Bacillus sp. ISL-39 TaxID=2819124 RepID=UPI001BEAF174|nr:NAD(P)H-dependent oxidoreductase [Bacillus sp. ISL-39]MBT2639878.1 NAD(P)H-dependent oxidoreductase [Bacillus sp. ISL-39]
MNVLIVFAHPDGQSLNGALKDVTVESLEQIGHKVEVSDLYEKNFKAIADKEDFLVLKNPKRLNYISEQYHALIHNTLAADIVEEQRLVTWADLIIFQYPMWWTDAPAILKGWFDRVFAYGFAYGPGRYEEGNLKGKMAIVSVTHGAADLSEYGETAIKGKVEERLFNIQHEKLYYCGMTVLEPFLFPAGADEETRLQHIEDWKERLAGLKDEILVDI